jgi:hypothetical protein
MSVMHPSSIRPFLILRPRHHVFPNVSFSKRKTALLPNDGALPTAGTFTECFEENFVSNGVSLLNSAHKSFSFLYQFLVLTKQHRNEPRFHLNDPLIKVNKLIEENPANSKPSLGRPWAVRSPP